MHTVDVIGAGRWGRTLIQNLAEMNALGAIADPRLVREGLPDHIVAQPTFHDHRTLLATGTRSPVVIATPSHTHAEIAASCISAGRDVFLEKPMTLESADAVALVQQARARQTVLMVGHLLLYQPAVHFVRRYLSEGRLGRIRRFHHDRLGTAVPRAGLAGENVLWNLGVHDVALSLFFAGTEPVTVEASGQNGSAGVMEDVHVHLIYPDGVESWIHSSWVWPKRVRQTTIVGEAGVLVYDELAQRVTLYPGLDRPPKGSVPPSQELHKGHPQPLKLELEHFLGCVKKRQAPRSDGEHGVSVVQVLERAMASCSV